MAADNMFSKVDFGPLKQYLEDDDITDISYNNGGQLWLKSLARGMYREDGAAEINDALLSKLAFQCSNIMGKAFNNAHPFLDAEGAELRLNFVHESIAKNGIACVMRKTPAMIRLKKEKIFDEEYITESVHDFLIKSVLGHCNILVSGQTGSGKTEFVKYLAAHTRENEKIITIEDTLELHLDRIFPHRNIVSMKTNNIAAYSDVLVTCMRQNPKWILLSEVRSAEAVTAVRNSISSGHNILSTIHADKAQSVPDRLYSLLESNIEMDQFLSSIYRYVQLAVHIRGYFSKKHNRFQREVCEVCEFYVTPDNEPKHNIIYKKSIEGAVILNNPSMYLKNYIEGQGIKLNDFTADEMENASRSEKEMTAKAEGMEVDIVEEPKKDISFEEFVEKTSSIGTEPKQSPTPSVEAETVMPKAEPIIQAAQAVTSAPEVNIVSLEPKPLAPAAVTQASVVPMAPEPVVSPQIPAVATPAPSNSLDFFGSDDDNVIL